MGKDTAQKILPIFFFWDLVYLLSPALADDVLKYGVLRPIYWNARNLIRSPLDLVFQGTKVHLWFMVSLLMALWSLAIMVQLNVRLRNVFAFSAALYCLGLLGGSYATTPIGINLHFNTRNFIFLSMLCVTIGWALSQHDVKFLYRFAVILIGFGLAVHIAEAYFLWKYWQVDPTKHDYLIGTIFFATGVALLSLRKTKNDTETIISRFGRYTLGIYGGHFVFVDMLEPMRHYMPTGLWQIVFPVLVYALSLTTAIALSRTRFRQFVA
ncbi:MAG TPA: acyltransferase family protein [Nitrospirota bacterium]|nr:acyltransferase family protein [Nitrospirota bacterium]